LYSKPIADLEVQMPDKYNSPNDRRNLDNILPTPEQRSYEQGYTQGQRAEENELQYQRERAAENSGAASGLIIGGILASLVGIGAAYYYWAQSAPIPTTIINTPPIPSASAPAAPQTETKIIERTIEKPAPTPTTKVVEVPKPILVPGATKVVEVPKPILVPGATKVVEVPKLFAVPVVPATPAKSSAPKDNSEKDSSSPSANPSPAASDTRTSPSSPDTGAN
jgi:hypothetical protein